MGIHDVHSQPTDGVQGVQSEQLNGAKEKVGKPGAPPKKLSKGKLFKKQFKNDFGFIFKFLAAPSLKSKEIISSCSAKKIEETKKQIQLDEEALKLCKNKLDAIREKNPDKDKKIMEFIAAIDQGKVSEKGKVKTELKNMGLANDTLRNIENFARNYKQAETRLADGQKALVRAKRTRKTMGITTPALIALQVPWTIMLLPALPIWGALGLINASKAALTGKTLAGKDLQEMNTLKSNVDSKLSAKEVKDK